MNKIESKVSLSWNLEESQALTAEKKELLRRKLKTKLSSDGVFSLYCQETRSQIRNKEIVSARFLELIERLLKPTKPRKTTKPTRASVERRIKAKKIRSERKKGRKLP